MRGCLQVGRLSISPAKSLSIWLSSMLVLTRPCRNWDDNFMKLACATPQTVRVIDSEEFWFSHFLSNISIYSYAHNKPIVCPFMK